ncbi:MAG: redoxin family protein [Archangium sp.]|nr:redoxin family protein [Archangium sp.]
MSSLLLACAHVPTPSAAPSLTTLDGAPINFAAELGTHDATVVVFFSTSCPCVARYERRVEALSAAYAARGVRVVYVSSNADDDARALRSALQARAIQLPLWVDWSGALAAQLEARTTPTVVVLDRSGAVKFRGWVDNERDVGERDRTPWLERALDSMLSGAPVDVAASPTFGCRITQAFGSPRVCPTLQ